MVSMFSAAETFEIAFKFLSTSASLYGIWILLRSTVGEIILEQLKSYFASFFHHLFTRRSTNLTLVINKSTRFSRNLVYDAADLYLRDKSDPEMIGPKIKRLMLSKTERQKDFAFSVDNGEEIVDIFEGIQLKWRYLCKEEDESSEKQEFFELSFNRKFTKKVVKHYLPDVLKTAEKIQEKNKVVNIYSHDSGGGGWRSMILEHPAKFETVAMDPDKKTMVISDLKRFVQRREFYKNAGRAWKRGYLLYGPPGTGKSTLIAAMANYLKFDIYDLELASIYSNSSLRNLLLSTTNRSILVIEDIDCSIRFQDRKIQLESDDSKGRFTLSGILNCIDGLWSSCGDEKIIVLTTNNKDGLDPALLRPGRTDMHIPMSYCTPCGFRLLAKNYIGAEIYMEIKDCELFGKIEEAIKTTKVTPAEVAEQLTRYDDNSDTLLHDLIQFLEGKKKENEELKGPEESCTTRIDSQ